MSYQYVTHGEGGTTVMTRKYRWKNEFCLMNDKEEVVKEFNVQVYFNQTGITECHHGCGFPASHGAY